jgi:glycosyltransferase involved in cell wall biosynthesis
MQPKLVSVMMPAYNAERYIRQAIESLLTQTYPYWELIIVNDGSTDQTEQILQQMSDPRIKVIHQANGGEANARNCALRHMQGEYVAFLDADDLYSPQHLEHTVSYLQTHPNCDGVYTDGYYCNANGQRLKTLSSRRRGPFTGHIFEAAVTASDIFGPPVCVVLRRAAIIQSNLRFDEDITIGPDWVFFITYAAVAQFGYLDQYTCLYRVHQTNITARIELQRRARELAKCRIRVIKMDSFQACSVETRAMVFYDLLVNLLRGCPEQQSTITHGPEFQALPTEEQAKLLRLMSSKTLLYEHEYGYVKDWLYRAHKLDTTDRRTSLLFILFRFNPFLCRLLLRAKTRQEADPLTIAPFADLEWVEAR